MTNIQPLDQPSGDLVGTTADAGIHRHGDLSRYSTTERGSLRALAGLDEASDGDLDMLGMVSERTGLDPFLKEVYLVGRKTKVGGYRGEPERWITKWTVQTGIDGFRKVLFRAADSAEKSHTIGEPIFYDQEGNERKIWLKKWGYPAAARVEVKLGDSVGVGLATWDEFVQTKKDGNPNSMWAQMGPTMLAKCAEAQAHRRVNSLTSGMYVPEEIRTDEPARMKATRTGGQERGADAVRAALAARKPEPAPAAEPEAEQGSPFTGAVAEIEAAKAQDDLGPIMNRYQNELAAEEYQDLVEVANQRWNALGGELDG